MIHNRIDLLIFPVYQVYSYYCDVPSCNFLTNFIEEAKFHKMEGHTVVDNHETTDELFSAAIKQCFDDLNESLEEKVTTAFILKKTEYWRL